MSLTSLLNNPIAQDIFRETFDFREYDIGAEMVAPPVTGNCAAIGVAFDYLARFWLKHRHPDAEERAWVAEMATHRLEKGIGGPGHAGAARRARALLATTKSEYATYIHTGEPTDGLMRAALGLATLDPVYYRDRIALHRMTRVVAHVGVKPLEGDIRDLRALWKVLEEGDLGEIQAPLSLNPDFGDASDLVNGADADIIADGFLIDIKTTKWPTFKRKYFDQLAGYAVLQRLAGGPDFRRIGVYFSRHGRLEEINVNHIYGAPKLENLLRVFPPMAEWMFGGGGNSG